MKSKLFALTAIAFVAYVIVIHYQVGQLLENYEFLFQHDAMLYQMSGLGSTRADIPDPLSSEDMDALTHNFKLTEPDSDSICEALEAEATAGVLLDQAEYHQAWVIKKTDCGLLCWKARYAQAAYHLSWLLTDRLQEIRKAEAKEPAVAIVDMCQKTIWDENLGVGNSPEALIEFIRLMERRAGFYFELAEQPRGRVKSEIELRFLAGISLMGPVTARDD